MSSGFVSSGKIEGSEDVPSTENVLSHESSSEAWAAADAAIKAAREKQMSDSGLMGSQDGGKSLFEVLQANKARKQEAFEEKLKFKNQFRSLDDDEIEFLDTVASEKRAEEDAKKKELEARLDDFRKLQYDADHDPNSVPSAAIEESSNTWAVSGRRKRKKEKEKESSGTGLKLRKMSDGSKKENNSKPAGDTEPVETSKLAEKVVTTTAASSERHEPTAAKPALPNITSINAAQKPSSGLGGLVAYDSDSDDD